jgi:hypothetical protein
MKILKKNLSAHQGLLRETSIIEAILYFLQYAFAPERRSALRKVCLKILTTLFDNLTVQNFITLFDDTNHDNEQPVIINEEFSNANMAAAQHGEHAATITAMKNGEEPILCNVFHYIYRLLKQFLLGSDHENQVHVVKHFDTLLEHLDLNLGAADALMQLIEGNITIVQSIERNQIAYFVKLLARVLIKIYEFF